MSHPCKQQIQLLDQSPDSYLALQPYGISEPDKLDSPHLVDNYNFYLIPLSVYNKTWKSNTIHGIWQKFPEWRIHEDDHWTDLYTILKQMPDPSQKVYRRLTNEYKQINEYNLSTPTTNYSMKKASTQCLVNHCNLNLLDYCDQTKYTIRYYFKDPIKPTAYIQKKKTENIDNCIPLVEPKKKHIVAYCCNNKVVRPYRGKTYVNTVVIEKQ